MVEKLGIDRSIIDDLSNHLYKNYGTTMAGLRVCVITLFSFLIKLKSAIGLVSRITQS